MVAKLLRYRTYEATHRTGHYIHRCLPDARLKLHMDGMLYEIFIADTD
jgi:hypothetical protein